MRLFNQTKNALRWSMGGNTYECEPWGSVVVDDDLVAPVRSRGLPLDLVPVAPEVKAHARVAEAQAEVRDEALDGLREQVVRSKSDAATARAEVEAQSVELSKERERATKLERDLELTKAQLATSASEQQAAEALLINKGESESNELRELTARVATALAEAGAAKEESRRCAAELLGVQELLAAKEAELVLTKAETLRLVADKKAADELLEDTARSASDFEKRAKSAEAALSELRSKKTEKRAS